MAQKTIMVDDLDGSTKNVETITFSLENKDYEIDLNEDNAQRLRDALAPFIDAARRSTTKRPRPARSTAADAMKIREWAVANGYEVNARGRIPSEIREAYLNAH